MNYSDGLQAACHAFLALWHRRKSTSCIWRRHEGLVPVPIASFTFVAVFYMICVSNCILGVRGIDCFKCVSLNGDNPACEDPFHNNSSDAILERPCMAGRKHRDGLFPATACIKLAGYHVSTGDRLMIRACALDSGTLTTDTEIIRVSHCGSFYFNNRYMKGCLQSCSDGNGCNDSTRIHDHTILQGFLVIHLIRILFIR